MGEHRNILVVTPAPKGARTGNRVTALRWAGHLRSLGHRVRIQGAFRGEACDVLVAIHAVKSAPSVQRFRRERPGGALVVAIAGTDLYGPEGLGATALDSAEAATRIVVLQDNAIAGLPESLRWKARTILQSASAVAAPTAPDAFEVCVIGNLREIKDPFRTALAARLLPPASRVRVLHVGAALAPSMEQRARAEERDNPRYEWLGELSRRATLQVVSRSRLLVLTSLGEGGANVISEAIAASVPVVTSHIPGSLGILGEDYPGTFPAGDTGALARLLQRCEEEPAFLGELQAWCTRLQPVLSPARERAAWADLLAELSAAAEFADEVRSGLTATSKRLCCRYFYDAAGSALFEQICAVPEYYIPAADREILAEHAEAIAASVPAGAEIVELGSGSAVKTRIIIEAFLRKTGQARYVPIDISAAALAHCARALRADYPDLEVVPALGEYESSVARLRADPRAKLILWLGSNIGNLTRADAAAFLGRIGAVLSPDDRLLVGIDLRKDAETVERAYDDALGVTARFNRNLLVRVNRELGGHFDVERFRHRAEYDVTEGVLRMYLISEEATQVAIDALGLEVAFAAGEAIHTEDSYKYSLAEIKALSRSAGLKLVHHWQDARGYFSENLLAPGLQLVELFGTVAYDPKYDYKAERRKRR